MINCETCGKEFEKRSWEKNRRYCSLECSSKSQRKRIDRTCEHCGAIFECHPFKSDSRRFCSLTCWNDYRKQNQRVALRCQSCGEDFSAMSSEMKRGRIFCSLECYIDSVNGIDVESVTGELPIDVSGLTIHTEGFTELDIKRFWTKVDVKSETDCWEWIPRKTWNGYGHFSINGKLKMAHRIAWFFLNGPIPRGKVIMHKCDNPACVNPLHLKIGSQLQNIRDREDKGRGARGERRGSAKLTENQVREIRRKYVPREYTYARLAEEYGVHRDTIGDIVNRRKWTHVE